MVFRDAKIRQCYEGQVVKPSGAGNVRLVFFFFYCFYFFGQSIKESLLGDAINQMTSNRSLTVLYM